jgi:hypothetical protein
MEKLLNENHINFSEASSFGSDKKDKRAKYEEIGNNIYSLFLESMLNNQLDIDKIKALIVLEQDIHKIKDRNKYMLS